MKSTPIIKSTSIENEERKGLPRAEDIEPGQSGRNSTAAGGKPGSLGNLPPSQHRPFTPVGGDSGKSRNPSDK